MSQERIAIIGTGLIGTSIGLVLAGRKDRKYEVVGTDLERARARTAKKMGAIDREISSYRDAVADAGLVILAVPVLAAREVMENMAEHLRPGAVVTDTCSTKASVLQWAGELLGNEIHFVGGHPMAGNETSGPKSASSELFQGASWALVPSPAASEEAVRVVHGMITLAGAEAVYIDGAEHDQYVAAISHLPILVSVALFRMARESLGWEDAAILSGPAFRDLTRLASGDPTMAGDIMETNREAVLHWLGRFRDELNGVEEAVKNGGEEMVDLFVKTSLDRDSFVMNPPVRQPPAGPETPNSQDAMWRLFAGGLYDRYKDAMDRAGKTDPRQEAELRRKLGAKGRGR